jgi:hypothetical protein
MQAPASQTHKHHAITPRDNRRQLPPRGLGNTEFHNQSLYELN